MDIEKKRDEIRSDVTLILLTEAHLNTLQASNISDLIVCYLHSQGCVLRVDEKIVYGGDKLKPSFVAPLIADEKAEKETEAEG